MTHIEVIIDEIVVRGLTPADARAVMAALQSQLEERAGAWATTGDVVADRREASRRLPDSSTGDLADAVWSAVIGRQR